MEPVKYASKQSPRRDVKTWATLGQNSENILRENADSTRIPPTKARIEQELKVVGDITLSQELMTWVDRYSAVGHRNMFLWKWCWRGVEVTTLPCVPHELRRDLADTKVLGVMLDVLMDDVADERGSSEFLEYLLSIPYGSSPPTGVSHLTFTPVQHEYAELTRAVWQEIQVRVAKLARYQEFASALEFDYRQLFNAMRYSLLINNDPTLLNLTEHDLYLPHNMHMMISAMMDIMGSPGFDHRELGALREAIWRAQYMGRIGNLITTWEREIGERDFTSGVFAAAMSSGTVSPEMLFEPNREEIAEAIRAGKHEEYFLERWRKCQGELLLMQPKLLSVDLGELIAGLESLICLHLGSRGNK